MQNFLIFKPILFTFTIPIGLTETIPALKSKELMKKTKKLRSPTSIISTKLKWYNSKRRVEFKPSCFKQEKVTYSRKCSKFIYVLWIKYVFILKDCLFGAVKLTKNNVPDKYYYSGYDNRFDSHSLFSILYSWGKNVTFFGIGSSS